ncbi:MAG: hypothetical protein WC651_02395 [Candidatus Gracilibacteria bacterium]|jgi:hypothetical protein
MDELTQQTPTQPLADAPLATATPATTTETPVTPTMTPEPTQVTATVDPAATPAQNTTPTQATPAVDPATPAATSTSTQAPQNAILQMLIENKKLVIIGLIAVAAVIIGLSVLIGTKSSGEYQGLIKKIETQTKELNETNILAPESAASKSEEIIPASTEETEEKTPAGVPR